MNAKPAKSKMIEKSIANGKEWEIPPNKGGGCLMVFGFVFCLIPLSALTVIIYSVVTGAGEQPSIWVILGVCLFLSVFLMVGGGTMYFGYKSSRTTHAVRVQNGAVEVVKQFAKKETVEKLERRNVRGVGLYVSSKQKGRSNYGLVVKGRDGNDLRLLSGHNQDELRWLASEMLESLSEQGGLPTEQEMEEMYVGKEDEGGEAQSSSANFAKQGVKISLLGGDEFEIEKKGNAIAKTLIIGGLFGMIFSSVFIWIGFYADDGSIIFGIVGGIFGLISLILFLNGLSKIGTTEKFTFKSDIIVKENQRGRLSSKKTVYQKSSFNTLEVKSSGSSNNDERYSVTLRGFTENLKIFQWVSQDVSQAVKIKVNEWLKPEAESPRSGNETEKSISSGYGGAIKVEKTSASVAPPLREKILPQDIPIYSSVPSLNDMKGGKWFLRLFLAVFIAVGLGLTITGISNIKSAKESVHWPTVNGVISKSKVKSSTSDGSTTYGADISYDYQVKGQTFKGDKVSFGDVSTSSRSRASKIVDRYPAGKTVAVIYNPDDPEDSILEPGLTGGIWLMPGVGAAFFIIPLFILIAAERSHRTDAKNGTDKKAKPTKHTAEEIQKKYGKME